MRRDSSIGEVATYVRGITFAPEDKVPDLPDALACLRTKNIQDELDLGDLIYVPAHLAARDELRLREGDILISSANSWELVGKCCWVPRVDRPTTLGGFIAAVRAHDDVMVPRYLFHWLRTAETQHSIRACARQTTNIANLSVPRFEALRVPTPPVEEQRRIADVLDKADAIRRKRREALALTDELLRATFLEMFGDPVTNPRGWPRRELAEFIVPDDSINYGVVQPGAAEDTGIPIVRVGDFRGLSISQSGLMRIAPEIEAGHKRSRLNGREILVACVGSIGKVALVDDSLRGFNIARAVARIPLGNELERVFAAHLLTTDHVQHFWRNETRTVSQPTLNIRQICMTPIYLPPLEKQREFSRMAGLIAKTTQAFEFSAAEMERLFAALQHRAFRGEL